jgi:hypothetical protein
VFTVCDDTATKMLASTIQFSTNNPPPPRKAHAPGPDVEKTPRSKNQAPSQVRPNQVWCFRYLTVCNPHPTDTTNQQTHRSAAGHVSATGQGRVDVPQPTQVTLPNTNG